MKDLIQAVKDHALEHYDSKDKKGRGPWDIVVECYDEEDWKGVLSGCATVAEALDMVWRDISGTVSYREEVQQHSIDMDGTREEQIQDAVEDAMEQYRKGREDGF